MMLSPQAARMSVYTTLRKIRSSRRVTPFTVSRFFKSTQAIVEEEDDLAEVMLDHRFKGHASAAAFRVESVKEYPWAINLHRGNNNAWLSDTRNEREWFTGLDPKDCPGKCIW